MTESQSAGVLVGTLHAKDPDEGENGTVFYSLTGILHPGNVKDNPGCPRFEHKFMIQLST